MGNVVSFRRAQARQERFETVVEPLIGRNLPLPPALEALMQRESRFETIDAAPRALRAAMG